MPLLIRLHVDPVHWMSGHIDIDPLRTVLGHQVFDVVGPHIGIPLTDQARKLGMLSKKVLELNEAPRHEVVNILHRLTVTMTQHFEYEHSPHADVKLHLERLDEPVWEGRIAWPELRQN